VAKIPVNFCHLVLQLDLTKGGTDNLPTAMAFTQFTIADLAATIVQPEDDLCTAIRKLLKAQRYAYLYMRYKYNSDGSISDAYCEELRVCAANTPTTTT